MHITVKGAEPYRYVYLSETITLKSGKTTSRNVKKFGKYSTLIAEDPEIIAKLKAQYETPKFVREEQSKARIKDVLDEISRKEYEAKTSDKEDKPIPALCYGIYPLFKLWDEILGLNYKIDYLKGQSDIKFDASRIASFMTALKVLDPASVLCAFNSQNSYVGDCLKDCYLEQIYRCYEFLANNKDPILKHVNKKLDKLYDRQYKMVFYDVSNVYFESTLTDEEKGYFRQNGKKIVAELINERVKKGELAWELLADDKGELDFEALPEDLRRDVKEAMFLRMRGKSKELRYDLPLVSIALVIDDMGFPIDFEIYSGNSSEMVTMKNSIENLKKTYGIKSAIVVADRGLNSISNMNMLLDNKLGFMVAQRIDHLDKETLNEMLDLKTYQDVTNKTTGEVIYSYKIKENYVKANKDESCKCTLVCTYSKKRHEHDVRVLNEALLRANNAVNNGATMRSANCGFNSLVKKDNKNPKAKGINWKNYESRSELCGFSAFIYCDPPATKESQDNTDSPLEGEQLIQAYHQLEKIEECFKVMKSNLSIRPMYVRNDLHIKGHCFICVLALILLKLLERKLKEHGTPMCINRIIDALSSASVAPIPTGKQDMAYLNVMTHNKFYKDHHSLSADELIKILKNEHPDINTIMKCVGLTPVPTVGDRIALSKSLGRRFISDEALVGKVILSML